ncbi:MAG: DUF5671 domain-containing protein [Candidatus Buchananbacteria bacterium]
MGKQSTSAVAKELKQVHGPKALFWFLTLFFTLGISAFSIGGLWFQVINKFFTKEIQYGQVVSAFSQNVLKWQIAALIIAVPVYFILAILIRRALKNGQLQANNKVRLWITYIILFIVVAVAVGDLITATFYLLNGDFTTRFFLKSLAILLIVSWIFVYYWLEIRSEKSLTTSWLPKIMGITTVAVIVVSFVGSFFIVESPAMARKRAYDATRLNDLSTIKYSVDNYYQEYKKLPDTLDALKTNNAYLKIVDPKSNQPYEYQVIDQITYELCANFDLSNKNITPDATNYYLGDGQFLYDAGRNCFTRKANDYFKGNQPAEVVPAAVKPVN